MVSILASLFLECDFDCLLFFQEFRPRLELGMADGNRFPVPIGANLDWKNGDQGGFTNSFPGQILNLACYATFPTYAISDQRES